LSQLRELPASGVLVFRLTCISFRGKGLHSQCPVTHILLRVLSVLPYVVAGTGVVVGLRRRSEFWDQIR
jgi:hypothetical protein